MRNSIALLVQPGDDASNCSLKPLGKWTQTNDSLLNWQINAQWVFIAEITCQVLGCPIGTVSMGRFEGVSIYKLWAKKASEKSLLYMRPLKIYCFQILTWKEFCATKVSMAMASIVTQVLYCKHGSWILRSSSRFFSANHSPVRLPGTPADCLLAISCLLNSAPTVGPNSAAFHETQLQPFQTCGTFFLHSLDYVRILFPVVLIRGIWNTLLSGCILENILLQVEETETQLPQSIAVFNGWREKIPWGGNATMSLELSGFRRRGL